MGNRFNKHMQLTSKNVSLVVDDILEMWFIIDTKMDTALSQFDREERTSLINNYSSFCQDSFILIGKLCNQSLDRNKIKDAIAFIKYVHDSVLFFIGGSNFKDLHTFSDDLFDSWLTPKIESLYNSVA